MTFASSVKRLAGPSSVTTLAQLAKAQPSARPHVFTFDGFHRTQNGAVLSTYFFQINNNISF
jgi:hypothetical protein